MRANAISTRPPSCSWTKPRPTPACPALRTRAARRALLARRSARALEDHHRHGRPAHQRPDRHHAARWSHERRTLPHLCHGHSGPGAEAGRRRHPRQPPSPQGDRCTRGHRGCRCQAPLLSALEFRSRSDREGGRQAQGHLAHSCKTHHARPVIRHQTSLRRPHARCMPKLPHSHRIRCL